MARRTINTLRNYPTHEEYSGLRASPRLLKLSKSVHSPVTVRIASPDAVRSPSLLLRQLDAEVKADPCSKESVISAIRQCRRRTVEKDRSDISLTEVKDNEIKRLRSDDSSGASTPVSKTSSTSDANGEVSKKVVFDELHASTCHGIVSKTPRNAISSSISSSRLATNNKKRLFEETLVEDDEIVVPSKKFIHSLQEKKLPHTNVNEVSVSIVGKILKQSPKRHLQDVRKSETESDGQQKLQRSHGHRKMPAFSAMESSTFLFPSTPYEFTAKDLAETRYQAEERVKRFRQELKEEEEQEQSKLPVENKERALGSVLGTQEATQSHILSTSLSGKGLSQLTSLIKEQSQSNQQVSSTIKSAELLSQRTTLNSGSSSLPGLNLEGLTKSSTSLNLLSNPSTSSTITKGSSPLITASLGQKSGTGIVGVSSVSAASIPSTQLTTTFNFGGSTTSTPSTIQTTPAKSLANPDMSTKNASGTFSLSGFNVGSKDSNQSLGGTKTSGSKFLTGSGQGIIFGGTGDQLTSTKHPVTGVVGGTTTGMTLSSSSMNQPTSISTSNFSFGGLLNNDGNNQSPLPVSQTQKKATNLLDFSKSSRPVIGNMGTNIFGTPTPTAGLATSSVSSQQPTSSPFQFTSAGQHPDNLSSIKASTALFPSGTGGSFTESHKTSFIPIFGEASSSVPSSMTPSQSSFNPIFGLPSNPPEGGFNFKPTSVSRASTVTTAGQTSAPAFAFGAKSSSASGMSSIGASTPASSSFNFGASSTMKNTNSSSINMTGPSKTGFNFGASSQPSSSSFQFGQSNPPTYLQSTQSGMSFGQSQSTPAFGQTTQTMSGFGQSSSSTPAFGQTNQSSFTPVASNTYGQSNQPNVFGQTNQTVPAFGQSSSQPAFGQTSNQGENKGFQFGSSSTPSFGQSVGGFGQSSQAGPSAFGQQLTPSFGQSENIQQGFNFAGSGTTPPPNFGSVGFPATPTVQNPNTFSVGTGGIARDRKKYAARRKVNKRR